MRWKLVSFSLAGRRNFLPSGNIPRLDRMDIHLFFLEITSLLMWLLEKQLCSLTSLLLILEGLRSDTGFLSYELTFADFILSVVSVNTSRQSALAQSISTGDVPPYRHRTLCGQISFSVTLAFLFSELFFQFLVLLRREKIHHRSQNLSWLTLKYHYFKIPEIQSIYLRRGFTLVRIYELSYVFADLAESAVASYALTATCAAPVHLCVNSRWLEVFFANAPSPPR